MIDEKRLEIVRSGTAEGLVLFYNLIFSDKGWLLPPHLIPITKALMDERIKNLQIIIGPGAGKSVLISIIYPLFFLLQTSPVPNSTPFPYQDVHSETGF